MHISLLKQFVTFFILLIIPLSCSQSSDEKISSHLEYSGYSKPEYKSFSKESRYIKMKDGTMIAADIFLPADGPTDRKLPSIFIFTPYGRSYLVPNLPWYKKIGARLSKGTWGPIFDYSTREDVKLFLSHGYSFIVADMRGAGASFGSQVPFSQDIVDDGVELINWIAGQPWSNGKVGMMERSYLGWIQLMIASRKPEPLKCIMPETILSDAFSEGIRPGGIAAIAWIKRYCELLYGLNLNRLDPDNMMLPTTPVIDEDKDGDLADEIPLMGKGDATTFLDDGTPSYQDNNKRKNIYYNATKEHTKNVLFSYTKNLPFIDSPASGIAKSTTFTNSSPGYYLSEIIKSGIPVYHIGGWFDGFTRGTTKMYSTMNGKNGAKLHIAPRFHYPPFINSDYISFFGYKGSYKKQLMTERLRFFDMYLKGIDNGLSKEPPVNIYVMNKGWRAEQEWPLKRQVLTKYYLQKRNLLSKEKGTTGADEYRVDFSHSSSYGTNSVNRFLMMYVPDKMMIRTDADKKCFIYETPILKEETEVTGHPIADIWVSSNQKDVDIYVYITDVDPQGRSLYVTEGQLRAGWKNTYDDNVQVDGKIDIKPDLPWPGYKKKQFVNDVLASGNPVNLKFDLFPTSWVFKKGHRIRIAIAGADYKNFEMNPSVCSGNEPQNCRDTTINIYRSEKYSSHIELPVIPSQRIEE